MLSYRRELDGLRALAVVAVIIYHAHVEVFGLHLFKGGFFGVDVFFVLSGYLITAIIRNDMSKDTFSFVNFYWRRAKRIVPALVTMLAVTSAIAYFILLPSDLITYAESLKSALYFGSNYYFYSEDSYVADASIYKPLLHIWSLAVEWQFYVIYPVIVWFVNSFFKQYMFEVLLGLALLSLQFSSFIVGNYPDMAFYLLPSRAWELILGGLATFYNRERLFVVREGSLEKVSYKTLPLLGLFLIIHSMFFVGHDIKHPSFTTLLPVIGTCLFLMFSHKGEASNDLLSIKPFVYIGLVSYSLYLWHQPVFVFFRFIKHDYFRYEQFALLVIISLLLAALTYLFVERVYRRKELNRYVLSLPLISVLSLGLLVNQTIKNEGFPERLKGVVKEAYDMYKVAEYRRLTFDQPGVSYTGSKRSQCNMRTPDTACRTGNEKWVTIGDSFVGQLDYALYEKLKSKGEGLIVLSHEQCPFVTSRIWFGSRPICSLANEDRWKIINDFNSPKNIILAANYAQFFKPKKRLDDPVDASKKGFKGGDKAEGDIAWESYANNVKKLLSMGHDVYVVYPVPRPGMDVKKVVFQQLKSQLSSYEQTWSKDIEAYSRAKSWTDKLDSFLPSHPNLHKIHPKDFLCKGESKCEVISELGGLYNGGDHLSYIGSNKVISNILNEG